MIIAHGVDKRLGIWDLETLKELFDFGVYDPQTDTWIELEISKDRNDLYEIVKFYSENKIFDYWVSFNGLGFDHQVMQFILTNYQTWYDLTGIEVCGKIHEFVQELIDSQKYEIPLPFNKFPVKAIDLFKIHHFDNEARRTSLKFCEFMMDIDIEEMPIGHDMTGMTTEDIATVKGYRRNDVLATFVLLYVTMGDLDSARELILNKFGYESSLESIKEYEGKNKLQDRVDVQKETGMDCMNWSDVKIGEEWNKLDYMSAENLKDTRTLFDRRVKHPYGQRFKNFFPSTMKFTTKLVTDFVSKLGERFVLAEDQDFDIRIGSTVHRLAKGGIHSEVKNSRIIPPQGWILRDADVGSQYPNSIVKLGIFPPHLKPTILEQFKMKITKRFQYKDKANELKATGNTNEARPYMSVQEMLKLCLNGGYYGKLGQRGSFLEYPEGLLKICMGNQLEILMLIEMMEEAGFLVKNSNTDGIVTMFPADKEDIYNQICKDWEVAVGNTVMGKLEFADFAGLWQENINSYIARKVDRDKEGKIKGYSTKKKGKFLTEFELHKNKSKRIVPLALEAYFIEGKDPIEFITKHENIFDFCIAKKAAGQLHYEELLPSGGIKKHKKLIRYFVSSNGNVFMKRGINNKGKPMNNNCEAIDPDYRWMGQPKLTYFNKVYKVENFSEYQVDHSYYIMEVLERIDAIEKTNKSRKYADTFKPQTQTSLF